MYLNDCLEVWSEWQGLLLARKLTYQIFFYWKVKVDPTFLVAIHLVLVSIRYHGICQVFAWQFLRISKSGQLYNPNVLKVRQSEIYLNDYRKLARILEHHFFH